MNSRAPAGRSSAGLRRKTTESLPGESEPYHGYFYKILKAQGANAPGGAFDYVVNGKMIGGFALVAYPARYGISGIMTFIVNQDGQVYEKNLGRDTAATAEAMKVFDPDSTWRKVEPQTDSPSQLLQALIPASGARTGGNAPRSAHHLNPLF